jgi:Uma2 family endonuclease
VPLDRILFRPAPGTAVEEDVVRLHDSENRLFELLDGVLVEKPMGFLESRIALVISHLLEGFVYEQSLGITTGADGMMRLAPGLVRIPDVSVILWTRLPGRKIPTDPIPELAPDLAVEVLSISNTPAEMQRKIGEYFNAGCSCVWLVNPTDQSVTVYSNPFESTTLSGASIVTGGDALPGFAVKVEEIFQRAGLA